MTRAARELISTEAGESIVHDPIDPTIPLATWVNVRFDLTLGASAAYDLYVQDHPFIHAVMSPAAPWAPGTWCPVIGFDHAGAPSSGFEAYVDDAPVWIVRATSRPRRSRR